MKTYNELIALKTFDERLEYLKTNSKVGNETFGSNRYLNQDFYKSTEWKWVRDYVIARDSGCDLGIQNRPIVGPIVIHHLNSISAEDIIQHSELLLSPDNLICVSKETHKLIHWVKEPDRPKVVTERKPNDTCPWK